MEKPYRKDLSHTTWDEVYARQERRAALVEEWLNDLQITSGARVLDVGAGPGYVSLVLADRVGPQGLVYAVDRSADALAYLKRLQHDRGITHIERIATDITTLDPGTLRPDSALVTMVLHHTEDPPGVLVSVAHLLPPGARVIVAEFHPEGPGEHGPPLSDRILPDQVLVWCTHAGFDVLTYRRQTPEHYMWSLRKRSRGDASCGPRSGGRTQMDENASSESPH
jgi:ubiquinone/menaquinone biosynthesis C-methylase UbiE